MRALFLFLAIVIVAIVVVANQKACFWHGDLMAWLDCLFR